MDTKNFDQLLAQTLRVEDDGFSALVLARLPEPKKSPLEIWQWRLWGATAVAVLAIALLAARGGSFTSMTSTSALFLGFISLVLFWMHFDESVV